jgi:hypothetical protein
MSFSFSEMRRDIVKSFKHEGREGNEGNSSDYSHLIRLQYLIPIVIDDLDRDLTFIGVGHVIPGCGSVAAN